MYVRSTWVRERLTTSPLKVPAAAISNCSCGIQKAATCSRPVTPPPPQVSRYHLNDPHANTSTKL